MQYELMDGTVSDFLNLLVEGFESLRAPTQHFCNQSPTGDSRRIRDFPPLGLALSVTSLSRPTDSVRALSGADPRAEVVLARKSLALLLVVTALALMAPVSALADGITLDGVDDNDRTLHLTSGGPAGRQPSGSGKALVRASALSSRPRTSLSCSASPPETRPWLESRRLRSS